MRAGDKGMKTIGGMTLLVGWNGERERETGGKKKKKHSCMHNRKKKQ